MRKLGGHWPDRELAVTLNRGHNPYPVRSRRVRLLETLRQEAPQDTNAKGSPNPERLVGIWPLSHVASVGEYAPSMMGRSAA